MAKRERHRHELGLISQLGDENHGETEQQGCEHQQLLGWWLSVGVIFGDASGRQPKRFVRPKVSPTGCCRFGNRVPQDQYVDYPIWGYSPSLSDMLPAPQQHPQLDGFEIRSGAISLNTRLHFFG